MLKRLKTMLTGRPRADYSGVSRNDDCPCGSGRKFKQCCIDKVERQARARHDAALFGGRKR